MRRLVRARRVGSRFDARLLSSAVGILFLWAPFDGLLVLTLFLACLLLTTGAFKIIGALVYRFNSWGWLLVSGALDLVLGVLIWLEWPASALWVLGLFVGISLIFRGFNWVGLGLGLRERNVRLGGLGR